VPPKRHRLRRAAYRAESEGRLGITSRIAAGILVLSLLSTAVSAVRSAMQERRERAEHAWHDAQACVLANTESPSSARPAALRQCSGTARGAAELSLELPAHGSRQLELQAALDGLARAIENGNQQQLSSAVDRSARAASALGWRMVPTRPH